MTAQQDHAPIPMDTPAFTVEKPCSVGVVLPAGHRVVIMGIGQRPTIAPMEEAGGYEIEFFELEPGFAFPMIVTIVPASAIPLVEKLTQETIDRAVLAAPTREPRKTH